MPATKLLIFLIFALPLEKHGGQIVWERVILPELLMRIKQFVMYQSGLIVILCIKLQNGGLEMKYGARNKLIARVKSVKKGDVMSLVKFNVKTPAEMASVLTTESVKELALKKGDTVQLIIKAIHVLPVKE